MTQNEIAARDELWESAARWLPVFSPGEQRAGNILHRELARGQRLTIAQFAQALGTSVDAAETLVNSSALSPFIHKDEGSRIQGFWGLSATPTHHKLTVDGRTLWTWCALDSLFMPELLVATADIESRDPETAELIRLRVSPDHIQAAAPADVVVSLGRPETWDSTSATRVIATACHFIFFFVSRASGERWQAKHPEPETALLSLNEAFEYGRRSNARLFGAELTRHRIEPA